MFWALCLILTGGLSAAESSQSSSRSRWVPDRAWEWSKAHPWMCGFNYVPSTAVNTTELWQAETFDPATIDRELGWAAGLGFNTCRIFVQYLVWTRDPAGLKERMDRFLSLADKHRISVMFCLFDDCAFSGKEPFLGKQDAPVPGVHNSAWTSSPGLKRVVDRSSWTDLRAYVADVVGRFARDRRVVVWDLYNEPGNSDMGNKSLPLLEATFTWSREAGPTQPLTVGIWTDGLKEINRCCIEQSDVVSFHLYASTEAVSRKIADLKKTGRPILCTEWMARPLGGNFRTGLPAFKKEGVSCYCWGLVNGKTQTQFPWGSPKGAPEPKVWFHDLFRRDGTVYDPNETQFIREFLR